MCSRDGSYGSIWPLPVLINPSQSSREAGEIEIKKREITGKKNLISVRDVCTFTCHVS